MSICESSIFVEAGFGVEPNGTLLPVPTIGFAAPGKPGFLDRPVLSLLNNSLSFRSGADDCLALKG
jgi:hypothetical protein